VFLTRQRLLLVLVTAAFYLVGQLLAGTEITVASLFALAILFGTLSIFAGGGLRCAFGCLNAILIGKFLLFGIAIKILLHEPADGTLAAPLTTALVMAIGFGALFMGTLVQSRLSCPQSWSFNRPFSNEMLLSFSIVLFVVSYAGYFAGLIPSTQGAAVQSGGWLGFARTLGPLKSFSIVPPMLYLWRTNAARWMTHPLIVAMLTWSALVGIFSTNKQDAMEPLAFYVLVGFLRYGFRDLRIWSLLSAGLVYYAVIIFPFSQYVRGTGARESTFERRIEITEETFWRVTSDQGFRSAVSDRIEKPGYFNQPLLAAFDRLALVGEADKLISATERQQAFTGWETITWGFKLMTPSFLFPGKPVLEAGNYLAHIAGEVGAADNTTEVSYGVMANLYNAFSFTGVFVGILLFFGGFYYWIRIFLGEAKWDGMPSTSTLFFIWLVALYGHSVVESSLSGVIPSMLFPVVIAFLFALAKCICLLLPSRPCIA